MKILRAGTLRSKKVYIGTCNACNCRIEFERGEAKSEGSVRNESLLRIKCPTEGCGCDIWVDE